jgi:hypothetical protein
MLDDASKYNLQMTEEEFLTRPDFTGAGEGSFFTPVEDRRPEAIKTET